MTPIELHTPLLVVPPPDAEPRRSPAARVRARPAAFLASVYQRCRGGPPGDGRDDQDGGRDDASVASTCSLRSLRSIEGPPTAAPARRRASLPAWPSRRRAGTGAAPAPSDGRRRSLPAGRVPPPPRYRALEAWERDLPDLRIDVPAEEAYIERLLRRMRGARDDKQHVLALSKALEQSQVRIRKRRRDGVEEFLR